MTSSDDLPPGLAAHLHELDERRQAEEARRRPVPSRSQLAAHHRAMEKAFDDLGRRFAAWALREGIEPIRFTGKMKGSWWRIGDLGTMEDASDPSIGEGMRYNRDHATWIVRTDGYVSTFYGRDRLGREADTSRFIAVTLARWGVDLAQLPSLPHRAVPAPAPELDRAFQLMGALLLSAAYVCGPFLTMFFVVFHGHTSGTLNGLGDDLLSLFCFGWLVSSFKVVPRIFRAFLA